LTVASDACTVTTPRCGTPLRSSATSQRGIRPRCCDRWCSGFWAIRGSPSSPSVGARSRPDGLAIATWSLRRRCVSCPPHARQLPGEDEGLPAATSRSSSRAPCVFSTSAART
jgi:hypothetical protein